MIKIGTVFSGIGAPEYAMQRIFEEVENVFACEIDKFARQSYEANHEVEHFYEDITTTDFSNHRIDILIGGSPCQAFSMAGKRKGFEDTRGTLFYEFARALKESKPEYFIFENVKGMVNHDKGNTMDVVLRTFGQLGYDITAKVLNSKEHGVPQNRERIFVVGVKNEQHIDKEMVRVKGKVLADKLHNKMVDLYEEEAINYFHEFLWPEPFPLTKRLKDVLEDDVDEKYYLDRPFEKVNSGNSGVVAKLTDVKFESAQRIYGTDGVSPALITQQGGDQEPKIQVPSATKQGYETATTGDRINLSVPNSARS